MTESSRAVFLSYASQDAEAAKRIANALRAAGIEVWFDQSELRGGDAWDQKIRQQVEGCHLFVPIISAITQAREEGYSRREWKLAVDRTNDMAEDRAFLLPIVIDGTSDSDARVPEKFREVQWTRLPVGANTDAFVDRVRRLLSPDAATPTAANVRPLAPPTSATGVASTDRRLQPTVRSCPGLWALYCSLRRGTWSRTSSWCRGTRCRRPKHPPRRPHTPRRSVTNRSQYCRSPT
ncbi:MAG: toll/interleukin-1 receptor domain-containing protein [Steroidobacteraceae bacterium]